MLKIKDEVDLKELEKFGYKPKYNVDTGELDRYQWRNCSSYDISIKDRIIGYEKFNTGYDIIKHYDYYFVNEVLFEMFLAGLVEKAKGE